MEGGRCVIMGGRFSDHALVEASPRTDAANARTWMWADPRQLMQVIAALKQPSLIIARRGRPSVAKNAAEDRRATNFLEELKKGTASQLTLTEHSVGASAAKNPGGKGKTKSAPTCSVCHQVGHRANSLKCPGSATTAKRTAAGTTTATTTAPSSAAPSTDATCSGSFVHVEPPQAPEGASLEAPATEAIGVRAEEPACDAAAPPSASSSMAAPQAPQSAPSSASSKMTEVQIAGELEALGCA